MYEVEPTDIYADMVNSRELYYPSNNASTDPMYNADFLLNRANVVLMTVKAAGSIIQEFVGLRRTCIRFMAAERTEDGASTC